MVVGKYMFIEFPMEKRCCVLLARLHCSFHNLTPCAGVVLSSSHLLWTRVFLCNPWVGQEQLAIKHIGVLMMSFGLPAFPSAPSQPNRRQGNCVQSHGKAGDSLSGISRKSLETSENLTAVWSFRSSSWSRLSFGDPCCSATLPLSCLFNEVNISGVMPLWPSVWYGT